MKDIDSTTTQSTEVTEREHASSNMSKYVIVLMVIIIAMMAVLIFQQKQKAEVMEEYAYEISALIAIKEDVLRVHGVTLEDVGLEELQENWLKKPCSATAEAYNNALQEVLQELEDQADSPNNQPSDAGAQV